MKRIGEQPLTQAERSKRYREKMKKEGRYQDYLEKARPKNKQWRDDNREFYLSQKRAATNQARLEMKEKVFNALGGKCAVCGFSDFRALQIDHVNGDGALDRKGRRGYGGGVHLLRQVAKELDSGRFQLLCANCHSIKSFEEGSFNGKKKWQSSQ